MIWRISFFFWHNFQRNLKSYSASCLVTGSTFVLETNEKESSLLYSVHSSANKSFCSLKVTSFSLWAHSHCAHHLSVFCHLKCSSQVTLATYNWTVPNCCLLWTTEPIKILFAIFSFFSVTLGASFSFFLREFVNFPNCRRRYVFVVIQKQNIKASIQ